MSPGCCAGARDSVAAARTLVDDSARVRGRHGTAVRLSVQSQRVYHQSRASLSRVVVHRTRAQFQMES